jgi:prepilin-type N-terminal cleavage/methylation domain-containing protein
MGGKKRGFTLIELLAVMAIIAVLAALGSKGYSLARRQAKESRAKAELETWRTALNEYRVEFGRFPVQPAPGELPRIDFLTNAVEHVVWIDPWGNPYLYVCTNRFLYSIWSEGQSTNSIADDINPQRIGY